jgi:eukaryotic-like serine/threonine-protein kinase
MNPLHPGDRLDHYRIESLVARSGMATIFKATDLDTGRPVAIKVPHPEMESDPVFFERFQREENIGKKLDHPGVIKALSGERGSRMYMVMEWVDGKLLRQVLNEQRKLPPGRALRIALSLARTLDYIHAKGVVHRDLKPENIVVGAEDSTKIIDFGIASNAGARRITFSNLQSALGTPDYISPEQVKGKRGDGKSDIYALGVMLYEMLTGKVPWTGSSPFLIMNDRLLNNPVPPRELDPTVSPELQEIVYRAIERDPRQRYPNAHEMILDLEHPDQVGVADREELRNWKRRRSPWPRRIAFYVLLALIPVVIFALLLFVAKHS